ncbi:class I SAM-dependent methyltransferase [Chloroflexota bacterium]
MCKRIDATGYDTDKNQPPNHPVTQYLRNYEEAFEHLVGQEIKLLELGVYKGGSLALWRDYFERGIIIGLDIAHVNIDDPSGRIRVYQGSQEDTHLLDRIAAEQAPEGFDVIIDDCSHIGELTRISFWHLFDNHLKPGGIYAIEDWGTGYWNWWPDGMCYKQQRPGAGVSIISLINRMVQLALSRLPYAISRLTSYRMSDHTKQRFPSHDFGMVGFVKELIDESGMGAITNPEWGVPPWRSSKFQRMIVIQSHVIIVKSQQ